jgi:hypothetical protein
MDPKIDGSSEQAASDSVWLVALSAAIGWGRMLDEQHGHLATVEKTP